MTEIRAEQRELSRQARAKSRELTKDTSEKRADEIEAEFDALMDRHDQLEDEAERLREDDERRAREARRPGGNGNSRGMETGDDSESRKFLGMLRGETRAMSVSAGPEGGFGVPAGIDLKIQDQLKEISGVRRVAEVVRIDVGDRARLVNLHGAGSAWGGEGATRSETDTPEISEIKPPSGELWAYPAVTTWLLSDAAFSVENFITENIATEFAVAEGAAFVTGDVVNKPRGFLTYTTAATADASRDFGTIEHLAAASATAIAPDELIDLVYKLAPAYRQGASAAWMMNSTTASAIRQLKDQQDRYLWTDGLQPGQPSMLLGYPVVEAADMPNAATGKVPCRVGFVIMSAFSCQPPTLQADACCTQLRTQTAAASSRCAAGSGIRHCGY